MLIVWKISKFHTRSASTKFDSREKSIRQKSCPGTWILLWQNLRNGLFSIRCISLNIWVTIKNDISNLFFEKWRFRTYIVYCLIPDIRDSTFRWKWNLWSGFGFWLSQAQTIRNCKSFFPFIYFISNYHILYFIL